MKIDLDRLEALAREAAPRPGEYHEWNIEHLFKRARLLDMRYLPKEEDFDHDRAAYIAAANPAVILALIARLRAAEGDYYCDAWPVCGPCSQRARAALSGEEGEG